MQFAVRTDRLGLLLVGAFTLNTPDVADRLAFGQIIDEILDTAIVEELGHTRVIDLCAERAVRNGFGLVQGKILIALSLRGIGFADGRSGIGRHGLAGTGSFRHRSHLMIRFAGSRLLRNILIDDGDLQPRHQKTGLADTVDKLLIRKFGGFVENFRIRPVPDACAGPLRRHLADNIQLGGLVLACALERGIRRRVFRVGIGIDAGMTLMERHMIGFAITVDLYVESGAQSIDHRRTDAVQTTDRII